MSNFTRNVSDKCITWERIQAKGYTVGMFLIISIILKISNFLNVSQKAQK